MPMKTLPGTRRHALVLYDVNHLMGGWDQVTPSLSLSPGHMRDGINFECVVTGGYGRISGYERVDGRPRPSDGMFQAIQLKNFNNIPTSGQTITGGSSLATGVVVGVTNNPKLVIVTKVTGIFTLNEVLRVGTTTIGTTVDTTILGSTLTPLLLQTGATQTIDGATNALGVTISDTSVLTITTGTLTVTDGPATLTALQSAQFLALAADNYRADIGPPPGSGPVRGVSSLIIAGMDTIYAFRDNAAGTATLMYKGSPTGWQLVPFYHEVLFTAGGAPVVIATNTTQTIDRGEIDIPTSLTISDTSSLIIEGTGKVVIGGFAAIPLDGTIVNQLVNDLILSGGTNSSIGTASTSPLVLKTNTLLTVTSEQDYPTSATISDTSSLVISGAGKVQIVTGTATLGEADYLSITISDTSKLTIDGTGEVTVGPKTDTVGRVVLRSGSWPNGTALGSLIIQNPPAGNFTGGLAFVSGVPVTLSGANTPITLKPGGRFEIVSANFFGQSTSLRLYGCDGVNRMWEFDGTILVPITTGTTPDTPKHIIEHKLQLFGAFQSSAIHSAPGAPYNWSALAGASELSTGDVVTGFQAAPGSQQTATLFIFARANTFVLYGTGVSNWNMTRFNVASGGRDFSIQGLDQAYSFEAGGLTAINTTLAYGNFAPQKLTYPISNFVALETQNVVASTINLLKGQYRVFFNDGTAIYTTIKNGKLIGNAQIQFPDRVFCSTNTGLANGNKTSYIGTTSGYVMELDKGSSFDGQPISAFMRLNWNYMKSPRYLKRMRRASIELSGTSYAAVTFGYRLGYGLPEVSQPSGVPNDATISAGARWDNMIWDLFTWDGQALSPSEVETDGTAENMEVSIGCGTNYILPFTINSVITHYSMRRGLR